MSGQMDQQTDRLRNELTSQHMYRNEIYLLGRETVFYGTALMTTLAEPTLFSCIFMCPTVLPKLGIPLLPETLVLCIKNSPPAQ